MAKIKVRVKDGSFPVRYDGERFSIGEEFVIVEEHLNKNTMDVLEVIQDQVDIVDYEKLKVEELKLIAEEKGIITEKMKKDELIAAIKAAESE